MLYKVGDEVRWVSVAMSVALGTKQGTLGVVTFVIPSDCSIDEFAMYDVEFDFGSFTLYGTQLERAEPEAA